MTAGGHPAATRAVWQDFVGDLGGNVAQPWLPESALESDYLCIDAEPGDFDAVGLGGAGRCFQPVAIG